MSSSCLDSVCEIWKLSRMSCHSTVGIELPKPVKARWPLARVSSSGARKANFEWMKEDAVR
jgi:hypothetical protein